MSATEKDDLETGLGILLCRLDALAHTTWLACSNEVFAIDTQAIHHVAGLQQQLISDFRETYPAGGTS